MVGGGLVGGGVGEWESQLNCCHLYYCSEAIHCKYTHIRMVHVQICTVGSWDCTLITFHLDIVGSVPG